MRKGIRAALGSATICWYIRLLNMSAPWTGIKHRIILIKSFLNKSKGMQILQQISLKIAPNNHFFLIAMSARRPRSASSTTLQTNCVVFSWTPFCRPQEILFGTLLNWQTKDAQGQWVLQPTTTVFLASTKTGKIAPKGDLLGGETKATIGRANIRFKGP